MRRPFIGNTERLFLWLLKLHRSEVVCDVGSFDGSHATRFREARPGARIIAFEADPDNVARIEREGSLEAARIELHGVAVGDTDGTVGFHSIQGPEDDPRPWGSLGSTRIRAPDESWPPWVRRPQTTVRVPIVRLDTVLADVGGSISLWIDVEGGAFEVLMGAVNTLERTKLVHVETETVEIWAGQRTESEVRRLLEERGFELLGRGPADVQRNLVFAKKRAMRRSTRLLSWSIVHSMRTLAPLWRTLSRRRSVVDSSSPAASSLS